MVCRKPTVDAIKIFHISFPPSRLRLRWPYPRPGLSGHFTLADGASLAERWLLAPQGGAVAVVAPSGEDITSRQQAFAQTSYKHMAAARTIGRALAAAQATASDIVSQYQLFGDPAMRLRP